MDARRILESCPQFGRLDAASLDPLVEMAKTQRFEKGETIRFLLKNSGQLPHEMVIGSLADLQAHAIEMRKNPGMKHVEPNAITLNPGQRGGLVWKFDQVGTIDFACTIPGHMEGGMVGSVRYQGPGAHPDNWQQTCQRAVAAL